MRSLILASALVLSAALPLGGVALGAPDCRSLQETLQSVIDSAAEGNAVYRQASSLSRQQADQVARSGGFATYPEVLRFGVNVARQAYDDCLRGATGMNFGPTDLKQLLANLRSGNLTPRTFNIQPLPELRPFSPDRPPFKSMYLPYRPLDPRLGAQPAPPREPLTIQARSGPIGLAKLPPKPAGSTGDLAVNLGFTFLGGRTDLSDEQAADIIIKRNQERIGDLSEQVAAVDARIEWLERFYEDTASATQLERNKAGLEVDRAQLESVRNDAVEAAISALSELVPGVPSGDADLATEIVDLVKELRRKAAAGESLTVENYSAIERVVVGTACKSKTLCAPVAATQALLNFAQAGYAQYLVLETDKRIQAPLEAREAHLKSLAWRIRAEQMVKESLLRQIEDRRRENGEIQRYMGR